VAFATAERLGLIHRTEPGSPVAPAKTDAHLRRAGRPGHAAGRDMTQLPDPSLALPNTAPVEKTTARQELPELPDPLLIAAPPSGAPRMLGLGPTAAASSIAPSRPAARAGSVARSAASAAPVARARAVPAKAQAEAAPATAHSARVVKLASRDVLARPYLAEPVARAGMPGTPSPGGSLTFFPAPPIRAQPPVSPAQPVIAPAVSPTSPPTAARPVRPAAAATVQPPDHAPASDPALFARALRTLRSAGDARAALALLRDHARSYPGSALASERSSLEVEALLALHRDSEALHKLDQMALGGLPRSGERFVVRGELRAGARRWQEARADFNRALSSVSGSPSWHARALWGRGVARLRCGEREAGLADLERYLDLYPNGRFAAQASRFFRDR
jgi:tetratricopeptide (TPR) repeat protein